MQLKELVNKEIAVGKRVKGYCRGVAISLKTHAVKYLLCAAAPNLTADFALSVSAVEEVGERIQLISLRPLLPKNSAKIFLGRPVYSAEGIYLGKIEDLTLQDFVARYLFTDQNERYSVGAIVAAQDALLLRRAQPFPLGSRIPASLRSRFTGKKDGLITKPVLRAAIGEGELLRLTLALSPFEVHI